MALLNLIVDGLWGAVSAKIFTFVILLLFAVSALFCLSPYKRPWIISKAPSLLTTLGLFGTFCGVAVGLGEFDVANIDQSVMKLLGGMKLAFWTSILGMLCAFCLNIGQYLGGVWSYRQTVGDVGAAEIYQALKDLLKALDNTTEDTSLVKEIQKLKTDCINAISGGQDPSLYRQFRRLRGEATQANQTLLQEFRALQTAFNNFAAQMAENNSNALIEALEKVMRDFNTQINEQFGDNFKQLNQAVGKLLVWQENYRTQLEALVGQFQVAQSGITAAQEGIERIKGNLDAVPAIMSQLQNIIVALDSGIKESGETLRAFTALRNQASEVFPTIKQGIAHLTEDLAASIRQSTDEVERSVKTMELSTKTQNDSIRKLGETSVAIATNVQTALAQGADKVQSVFVEAIDTMKESTSNSFEAFDKQTQESLSKVIQFMGDNLASIHQKLANDCQELTNEIRRLVEATYGQSRNRP